MSGVEARRDFFEEIRKVPVDVTAEQLVNVEPLAIEIREQRGAFLTCGLQKDVDEERTAGKLLDDQIACCFIGRDLLTTCDVFDEFFGSGWIELFETQDVQQLEVTFRVVSSLEDLAAESCEH